MSDKKEYRITKTTAVKKNLGAASPGVKKPYYGPGSLAYSLEHGEQVGGPHYGTGSLAFGGAKKTAKKPAKKSPAKSKKK